MKRARKSNGQFGKSDKVIVRCSVCNKKLIRTVNNVEGKKEFYCSYDCQYKRGKLKSIKRICPQCEKEFETYLSINQVFCCKNCYTNHGRKLYTCAYCGKQRIDKKCYSKTNKKWYCCMECLAKDRRNELTAPYKDISRTGRWKSWRKRVLKRDNFKCTECGAKHHLEAHHWKMSVKECIQKDKIDYIFALENGVTLCFDCHKLTETWGVKNK